MIARITFFVWLIALGAVAQPQHPWEQFLNEVMTREDVEQETWEHTYEQLCELEQHPLSINQVTREQLEELPFLSAQQIEELMAYRYAYGPMKSMNELLMIRSLDYSQRRLLNCFFYVDESETTSSHKPLSLKEILRYGRHELMATGRIPFYERKGDRDSYLGYPYRHWLRYQFTYSDYVRLGLVGAQDAGEPFLGHYNRWGYDYYSFWFQLRHLGRLESLVLGNFRVSMGMGLVMNNNFSLGKIAMLQNLGRQADILRAHSSRSGNYLRGMAATVGLGRDFSATAFFSYRPMDATLNKDSTISTILTTDYHRTETEMAKKHNSHALKTGGSLRWFHNGLRLGLNLVYTRLDRSMQPNTSVLYRRYYPKGRDFLNVSCDYGYVSHRFSMNGEAASDKDGHLATVNSVSLQLGDTWRLLALQRFYSYRYTALDAQSYADGGKVQNESGLYVGLNWQPSPQLQLTCYADYAYFAWARYQVSQSSHSWDYLLQMTLQRNSWSFGARYRLRMRQQDNADKTGLDNRWEHRVRLSAEFAGKCGFGSRTQFDGGYCAWGTGVGGAMLSETLSYEWRWLRLNAGAGWFRTDNYDSRVYLYEQSPLYTYSMMQFYGEGIRYWLMARVNLGRRLSLTAKIGVTDYFDRKQIGSGDQQIDASSQTDLDLQLRWVF